MFYYNLGYHFKPREGSPADVAGSIIAASGMAMHQLQRRKMKDHSHLQRRLFDPQLYLASLDALQATQTATTLSSYPWFGVSDVVAYDSREETQKEWMEREATSVAKRWPRLVPTKDEEIESAAHAAVVFQLALGCEYIILPSPLTTSPRRGYADEARWLDAGLAACYRLKVRCPVFATIAISDTVLRGMEPTTDGFLGLVTGHVAAREELAGAYVVIEQSAEEGYCCGSTDVLSAVLTITDDLVRGASRRVILNQMGTFGAVATAVGAEVWASGYYRSLRRLRLVDMHEGEGRSYPRYYSLKLLGDIGLEHDISVISKSPLYASVQTRTAAATSLHAALKANKTAADVAAWSYEMTNITAATAHYNEAMHKFGLHLSSLDGTERVDFVDGFLERAVDLAQNLKSLVPKLQKSDLSHQNAWLSAFRAWRTIAAI